MAQNKTVFDGMINRLEKICCKLSEIKDILTGNNTVNTNSTIVNTCANPVPVFFCPPEIPKIDPEVVCLSNDGGVTIVKGWEVFDVSTNPPTSKLYIGGVEVTGYTVVPCDKPMQYDYEIFEICHSGKRGTKVLVFDHSSLIPILISTLWLDENDVPMVQPSSYTLGVCEECDPKIGNTTGDSLPITNYDSYAFIKPLCCSLEVVTSIGSFIIPKDVAVYSINEFKCNFDVLQINIKSGNCSLSDIIINALKTK